MTYYRLDSTKLTFREFWQWQPGPMFLLLACFKLLRIRIGSGQHSVRPERIQPITLESLPDRHRAALDPLLAQSKSLGFKMEFCYSVQSRGPSTGAGAALTSADNLTLALLGHVAPVKALWSVPPCYVFYSYGGDGSMLATSGGLPGLIGAPPEFHVLKLRHGSLDNTWNRHVERISMKSARLLPVRSAEVADQLLRIIQSIFDYNIGRGVWVPLAETELEELH